MSNNVQSAVAAAKKRMKSGYWVNKANGVSPSVQQDDRADKMYEIVRGILESGELVTNPLARLMDTEYFSILSDVQRSCYVLELARTYIELKKRYYNSKSI